MHRTTRRFWKSFEDAIGPRDGKRNFELLSESIDRVSEGEIEEDTLENMKDAISLWLTTWEDIAVERKGMLRRVEVTV